MPQNCVQQFQAIAVDAGVIKDQLANINEWLKRQDAHLARLNGAVGDHASRLQTIDDFHKETAVPLVTVVRNVEKFSIEAKVVIRILSTLAIISTGALIGILYDLAK